MKIKKFYDTSSLLLLQDIEESFVISSITLDEIEHIKSSNNKNSELQANARKLIHWLENNSDKYDVILYKSNFISELAEQGFEITNDLKILGCALEYNKSAPIKFITNDLCLKHIAQLFLPVESIREKFDAYTGYKHLRLSDGEIADLYTKKPRMNHDLLPNEYGIIYDENGDLVDIVCWTGEYYRPINSKPINSKFFGKVSPYDIYQKMAIDSMRNNQLTIFRGPAGSAKSYLALTYLFSLLEKQEINRLYIFCNPVATLDSAKLGFYPGDRNSKLLDSQIGNFLVSKFGDYTYVESLVNSGRIMLIPCADLRGVSIPEGSGVYITEAQNSTKALMKLMLQRIESGVKCIIEGDDLAQVDLATYQNHNNGLRQASKIFRGQSIYGEVYLPNCYRGEIAQIAEKM